MRKVFKRLQLKYFPKGKGNSQSSPRGAESQVVKPKEEHFEYRVMKLKKIKDRDKILNTTREK